MDNSVGLYEMRSQTTPPLFKTHARVKILMERGGYDVTIQDLDWGRGYEWLDWGDEGRERGEVGLIKPASQSRS